MNAYEIADELDGRLDHKAANMLRQQADRIAELEKINNCYKKLEDASKITSKPLSQQYREPVAWAIKSDGDFTEIGWDNEVLHEVEEWYTAQGWQYEYLPLYTTPQTKPLSKPEECKDGCPELQVCDYCQQTKPLSDEEIGEIYWKLYADDWTEEDIKFARAIEERHGIK